MSITTNTSIKEGFYKCHYCLRSSIFRITNAYIEDKQSTIDIPLDFIEYYIGPITVELKCNTCLKKGTSMLNMYQNDHIYLKTIII